MDIDTGAKEIQAKCAKEKSSSCVCRQRMWICRLKIWRLWNSSWYAKFFKAVMCNLIFRVALSYFPLSPVPGQWSQVAPNSSHFQIRSLFLVLFCCILLCYLKRVQYIEETALERLTTGFTAIIQTISLC